MEIKRIPPVVVCVAVILAALSADAGAQRARLDQRYRDTAARLIKAATADDFAWQRLAELTDTYGNRLSGSENLTRAIAWAAETMKKDGLENVRTEQVMVPHWVRGTRERRDRRSPRSAGDARPRRNDRDAARRPRGGRARRRQLRRAAHARRGARKADRALQRAVHELRATRSATAPAARAPRRRQAPSASLVRSVGPDRPADAAHRQRADTSRTCRAIPAAAIAVEDANRIARLDRARPRSACTSRWRGTTNPTPSRPTWSARFAGARSPTRSSCSAATSIRGTSAPARRTTASAASSTWEAAAPDEEARHPAAAHRARGVVDQRRERACAAPPPTPNSTRPRRRTTSSRSRRTRACSSPRASASRGSLAARNVIRDITIAAGAAQLAETISGGGGADIDPIAQAGHVPTMAYMGDPTRYFTIHHTPADTVERIAPDEVSKARRRDRGHDVCGRGNAGAAAEVVTPTHSPRLGAMSLRKACRRFASGHLPSPWLAAGALSQSGYGFPPHCSVAEPDGCIRSDVLQQETKHR